MGEGFGVKFRGWTLVVNFHPGVYSSNSEWSSIVR